MNYLILAGLGLVLLQSISSAPNTAPWKSWTFCKKSDPTKSSSCLIKAIQGVEKDIVDGNSYFGLPKLNPLRIDELSLYQAGSSNSVAVNITFTNCEINGLLGWELLDARADWDAGKMRGVVSFRDKVLFDADFEVSGKVILLPVKGKGRAKVTFDGLVGTLDINGKNVNKKGKEYFSVDHVSVELNPKSAKFQFGSFLNTNTALSESINKALTENWKEIMEDVKGPIGEGLGAAFKQISNRIFAKIPFDVLVPN